MPKPAPEPRDLTPRQLQIMEIVWDQGEASALEVRNMLAETREVARNTVRTTMERLEAHGWLTHRLVGRTRFYSAAVPRQTTIGEKVVDVVDRICGGRPESLMSALLEHRGLAPDEIDRIEAMLAEARDQQSPGQTPQKKDRRR